MIEISIPGMGKLQIKHVVFDLNGTLSMNGKIDPRLPEKIRQLSKKGVSVHVLSANTRGNLNDLATQLGASPHVLEFKKKESEEKAAFIKELGSNSVVAIGNGNNDHLMLKEARLGMVILGEEGLATKALLSADLCVRSPLEAIDLLLDPIQILATLRD
ncbi:MAG: HAD family hydrolase [Candidatus Helarchaeales archaeon]